MFVSLFSRRRAKISLCASFAFWSSVWFSSAFRRKSGL